MLIDSHCHLDFPDFEADLPGVIARARAAGVTGMLTIATRVAKADTYRAIAEAHPEVWYTIGTHPHGAAEEPDVAAETIAAYLPMDRRQALARGAALPVGLPAPPRRST